MKDKIRFVLSSLTEEELLKVYACGADIDTQLSKETAQDIRKRTLRKLSISPYKKTTPFYFKVAVGTMIAVILAFTVVCAISQPVRDRIVQIFNGFPKETAEYTHPYLESPEYNPTKHTVEESIDLSKLDFSFVDKIAVTSGKTGEEKMFFETDELLSKIKTLKGHSPVSSRGYYGFGYGVKVYSGERIVYEFSVSTIDEKYVIIYGVYEEYDNKKYSCIYTSDESVKEFEAMLDESFGWK